MKRAALLALVACGSKQPQSSWIEREDPLGTSHVSAPATGSDAAPVNLATLDPATIDELDLATASAVLQQLGDQAPAARVALRAARLAYHQGDVADARAYVARAATAADEATVHAELTALGAALAAPPVDVPPVDVPPVLVPPVERPPVLVPPVAAPPVLVPPVAWPPVLVPPVEVPPVEVPPVA